MKKWSSLPILHFAIFHHYCHETGHSCFTMQPNKNLSKVKGSSFLYRSITVYIISVHRHSQQLWEANQASASNPLGHLPPPKWGWDDEEKNQDGIPHHAANIQALAGWEELVTHWQPDTSAVTWSKSDSGLLEHSSPTQPDSLPVKLSLGLSNIWCECEWRVESNCIFLDQNSFVLLQIFM